MARHLADHPEDRARVAAYRALDAALRDLARPVLDEPVPVRLRTAAAAVALALAGGAVGWFIHAPDGAGFAAEAAVAHKVFAAEKDHAVEVSDADPEHLAAWLTDRLGGPVPAPDLSAVGYHLLGGRLLSTASGPAAQIMYEDEGGDRMTLFYRADVRDEEEHAWRFADAAGITVYYWVRDGKAFAVAGTCDRAEMEAAGRLAMP